MKRYRVKLSAEERQGLKALVSRGRATAYKQTHGRILLLSDEAHADGAMKDEDIARVLQIGRATVERVRRRCVEEGSGAGLGAQGATEPASEAAGRSRGSPPRIQYGAGSDCLGLRRTAGGPGQLDAEVVGRPAGRMRDSGEHQHRNGAPDAQKNELKPPFCNGAGFG